MTQPTLTAAFDPGDEARAVAERREAWLPGYQLETAEDVWYFDQMVASSLRLESIRDRQARARAHSARRAALCWDDDRSDEAEELAARLPRDPAKVLPRLRQTLQGCRWLIARWDGLADSLRRRGSWGEAEAAVAADLAGIPADRRDLPPWQGFAGAAMLVAHHRGELERRARALVEVDADARDAAAAGAPLTLSRAEAALRREESACLKYHLWTRDRLEHARRPPAPAEAEPDEPPAPATPTPAPEVAPPAPPDQDDDLDLEADDPNLPPRPTASNWMDPRTAAALEAEMLRRIMAQYFDQVEAGAPAVGTPGVA